MKDVQKLVYMANQIGDFFKSQPQDKAAAGIADHIAKFWSRPMKEPIFAHMAAGGAGVHPLVATALRGLMENATLAPRGADQPAGAPEKPRTIDPDLEKLGLNNAIPDNANLGNAGS